MGGNLKGPPMKFRFFNTALISLSLSICALVNVANATLITETWQATVTGTLNNNLFQVNDTLNWTVTYDDSDLIMHTYSDGLDGIAQTSDDTVDETLDASCPSGSFCNFFTVAADAHVNLNDILVIMYDYVNYMNIDLLDIQNYNDAQRYQTGDYEGRAYVRHYMDSVQLNANFDLQRGDLGFGGLYVYTTNGVLGVNMDNIRILPPIDMIPVPEPSTLAIFALGMIGLASRRFKKQS